MGHILKIEPSVENPSDLKWENLEVTTVNRSFKLIGLSILILCLMIITIVIIVAATL